MASPIVTSSDTENLETHTSSELSNDEENANETPLIDFCMQFCKEDQKALLQETLVALGVETLSDLEYVDFKESFKEIMKPVQIRKLMEKFKQSELLLIE